MHVRLSCISPSSTLVLRAILIRRKPPGTLFRSLSSRSSISSGSLTRRDQCSTYPTDNSIILHAKTASDVLAQSASHLCEQITSYRKTDFIFDERRFRFFFCSPAPSDPSPRSTSLALRFFSIISLFLLMCAPYCVQ